MVRKQAKGRGGRKTNNPPELKGLHLRRWACNYLGRCYNHWGSAIQAVKRIEEETSCEVVAVISILDREEGGKEAFAEAGYHLKVFSYALIFLGENLQLNPSEADISGPTTVDSTAQGIIISLC